MSHESDRKSEGVSLSRVTDAIRLFLEGFHVRSLQFVIALSFSIVAILVTVFVGSSITSRYARAMEQDLETSTQQITAQVALGLENYLSDMSEVSDFIKADIDRSRIMTRDRLATLFETITSTRNDVVTLSVFDRSGRMMASSPQGELKAGLDVTAQDWFFDPADSSRLTRITVPHVQNLFPGVHPWVVSMSRSVSFIENNVVMDGILLVDLNFSGIDELCRQANLGKRGYVHILDEAGSIVYHPQQQMLYMGVKNENNLQLASMPDGIHAETFDGMRRLVQLQTLTRAPWRIAGVSYINDLVTSRESIAQYTLVIILAGVLLSLAMSVFISAKISKPVKRLDRLMKRAEQGDFSVVAVEEGEEEVRHLSHTFNVMISRIRTLMDQIVVEQEQKRKSEIMALQAQINPHFLYNTLDSIVWMAENGRTDDVVKMTDALARLFRVSISRGREMIPLSDELEHASSYMTIQQIRYRDKFSFCIDTEPRVRDIRIPKLILQPLLENAIYHGVRNSMDHGEIAVQAMQEGDQLVLIVSDTGNGMSAERLRNLLTREPDSGWDTDPGNASNRGSGVGLKNVHDRIRLYYGPEYGLEVESELDEGTTVTVRIPLNGRREGGMRHDAEYFWNP